MFIRKSFILQMLKDIAPFGASQCESKDESGGAAEGAFAVPWDGRVTDCRNDDVGERNPGNANDETLKEILNGPKARLFGRTPRMADWSIRPVRSARSIAARPTETDSP